LSKPVIIIVGGGSAGAAAAITLARKGLSPVVLESEKGASFKVGESLPPSANPILEQLGLKEKLSDYHLPSYGNRAVWGSEKPYERDFLFGPHGAGWHLDRRKFEETLAASALEAGADWRYGWRLTGCSERKSGWQLKVRNSAGEAELEADFVIDATGRAARFARGLGLRRVRYDRLIGAGLLLKSDRTAPSKDSSTLVEAVDSGWWYSALLPSSELMVIYMTDNDLLDHKTLRHKEGLLALLEKTSHTLGRVRAARYFPVTEPHIYAANSQRLSRIAGERWLAVGDAAAAYDPLSSYGIGAAMGSGFHAASSIADFITGSIEALPAYTRMMDRAYARYLMMNYDYYALEGRWPEKEFWQRRHRPRF
jgi:flavin-dependent dehydrogenase